MTMDLRTRLCFNLSRKLMRPPARRTVDYGSYEDWRHSSLSSSWRSFSDDRIDGKDVLDFGCGDGPLSLFLAATRKPRRIVGVDLKSEGLARARESKARSPELASVDLQFLQGKVEGLPVPDASFDTVLAFDCLEHVMAPRPILEDWFRVLRPGGRVLLEWFPFKGPWGPHMESLIPVPWAHVVFGQRAMFRAAEAIYDLPEFQPRHWDLDADGKKLPNKWKAWSSFREQGYVNELSVGEFKRLARAAGFEITRFEKRGFSGNALRRGLGRFLMSLPLVGEYFLSYVIVELQRPEKPAPPR